MSRAEPKILLDKVVFAQRLHLTILGVFPSLEGHVVFVLSVLRGNARLTRPPGIKPGEHRTLSGGHSLLILSVGAALSTSGPFRAPKS